MERRSGAEAAGTALRSLGRDGPWVGRRSAQTVGDLVLNRKDRFGGKRKPGARSPKALESESRAMKLNRSFAAPADMPATIPLFPLEGALLLPRRPIQLTVFEPRYLSMLDDALSGERLIGIIQPSSGDEKSDPSPELYPLGCAGSIVQFAA